MEDWLSRARTFAETAAKKSREIAVETAKYSEQFAKDAVKQSRVLAEEAAKKTDIGIKALVKELNTTALGPVPKVQASEAQLEEYGVTADLREFVRGLTIKTFKDFPLEHVDEMTASKDESAWGAPSVSKGSDLSPWQERHALLVLQTVEEISDFRYLLCPRRMTERRFWRIYFLLVHCHVAPFEAAAATKCGGGSQVEMTSGPPSAPPATPAPTPTPAPAPAHPAAPAPAPAPAPSAESVLPSSDHEPDLDEYLMASGEEDEEEEGDFDPEDFDHFVNSGADSDEGEGEGKKHSAGGKTKGTTPTSGLSSDGELVEAPSPESETGP